MEAALCGGWFRSDGAPATTSRGSRLETNQLEGATTTSNCVRSRSELGRVDARAISSTPALQLLLLPALKQRPQSTAAKQRAASISSPFLAQLTHFAREHVGAAGRCRLWRRGGASMGCARRATRVLCASSSVEQQRVRLVRQRPVRRQPSSGNIRQQQRRRRVRRSSGRGPVQLRLALPGKLLLGRAELRVLQLCSSAGLERRRLPLRALFALHLFCRRGAGGPFRRRLARLLLRHGAQCLDVLSHGVGRLPACTAV